MVRAWVGGRPLSNHWLSGARGEGDMRTRPFESLPHDCRTATATCSRAGRRVAGACPASTSLTSPPSAARVLDFGYRAEDSMPSHYGRYRRDLVTRRAGGSYEIDVCFPSAGDEQPLLLVEAKAEPRDIARWALAIDAGATATELIAVGFKEVEYVLELAPRHVWLVGPGTVDPARHVWAVMVDRLDVHFTRVSDVPVGVTSA